MIFLSCDCQGAALRFTRLASCALALFLLAALVAAPAGAQEPGSYLANGGFETGNTESWDETGTVSVASYQEDKASGGTPSASSTTAPYVAANAFDNNFLTSQWISTAKPTSGAPQWLRYQLPSSFAIQSYTITSSNSTTRAPRDWSLQGSDDAITWTDYDIRENETFAASWTTNTYWVDGSESHPYWQLRITDNNGDAGYVAIGEVEFRYPDNYAGSFVALLSSGAALAQTVEIDQDEGSVYVYIAVRMAGASTVGIEAGWDGCTQSTNYVDAWLGAWAYYQLVRAPCGGESADFLVNVFPGTTASAYIDAVSVVDASQGSETGGTPGAGGGDPWLYSFTGSLPDGDTFAVSRSATFGDVATFALLAGVVAVSILALGVSLSRRGIWGGK